MEKDSNIATFTFVTEDTPPLEHTVNIDYVNKVIDEVKINFFPFAGKKEFIENKIESASVYIPDNKDVKLFAYAFQYLVQFYNYSASMRTTSFPGKELLIIDYGLFSVNRETIEKLITAIINGVLQKETTVLEEVEEELPPSPIDDLLNNVTDSTDYPMPFVVSGDKFIEDDKNEFGIGTVEDD